VSRQGYAAWRRRQARPGRRELDDAALLAEIAAVFDESRGRYGSPRVHAELARRGVVAGRHRVARLMADNGLVGRSGRRRNAPRTTVADPAAAPAANLVARDFSPAGPDQLWATDVTYLRTSQGFLYLAAIIDCYSRMVVGWAVADHLRTELCLAALDDAVARRNPAPGLVHHSDRGCQYTSYAYRERLAGLGMTQSMSRKGNCWDNAVAESFFSTVKLEMVYGTDWADHAELQAALFEYIEVFYNRQRLHSTLDYNTPSDYDQAHQDTPIAA
jgi:putative transposase